MSTIYEELQLQPQFSGILTLIDLVDAGTGGTLVAVLDAPFPDITLFAPTNAGLLSLAQGLGFTGSTAADASQFIFDAMNLVTQENAMDLLLDILSYHVVTGPVVTDLSGTGDLTTLSGVPLAFDGNEMIDADPEFANAEVTALFTGLDNGTLVGLDSVMLPADLLMSDGSFAVDFGIGTNADESVQYGADNDYFDGQGGDDIIKTGAGDDTALGGRGDDIVRAGEGNDYVSGGNGDDELRGDNGRDTILGGNGDDELHGGNQNDALDGGNGNDRLDGDDGRDTLDGGSGNDRLIGGSGSDEMNGGRGADDMFGDGGGDLMNGDRGNDALHGGNGIDILNGGRGHDHLSGDSGRDILNGGRGEDTVAGGSGVDTFVFEKNWGSDRLTDYVDGQDLLDFQAFGLTDVSDLTLVQDGSHALITIDGENGELVTVLNTNIADFDNSDFIF